MTEQIVKVGKMPGRLTEVVVEQSTTIKEVLQHADLSTEGYQVKVDGSTVTDLNEEIGERSSVILTQQVKGNK